MDPAQLSRWTRFAAKGGIGKCTATHDCVAEGEEDLMFMKDDMITVLMQIPNLDGVYLGYCEGVVGRFQAQHVHFHSKLKKPVKAKRNSAASSRPTSSSGTLHAKSPTPSMFSTSSPTPGTPLTPTRPAHSPNSVSPNSPLTPNTPTFTNGAVGNTNGSANDHTGSRESKRASMVYTGPAAAAGSGLSTQSSSVKPSTPMVATPEGLLYLESLAASTSTTSTLNAVSVVENPQDTVSSLSPHSQPVQSQHAPSDSVTSFASSVSKYSSSQYSSHSPSPSIASVSTTHTAQTSHTIASVLSGHSTQTASTLDIDYGFPRVLSPNSMHSASSRHSGDPNINEAMALRPARKASIGALSRHPSTASSSTMTSTSSSARGKARKPSTDSYNTADASFLEEHEVDEADFEMVGPGRAGLHPATAIPPSTSGFGLGTTQPSSTSISTSASSPKLSYATSVPASLARSTSSASSVFETANRSLSRSGSASSKPKAPLSRSTSQKSVQSIASATSDGEIGIGLSLLASLGEGSSDDEDDEDIGDETLKLEGKSLDIDDEDTLPNMGLSYTQPIPSTSSTSVPAASANLVKSHSPTPSYASSSQSHSTYSDGHSPIPGDAVAAFPQPPQVNEMEVRRLSRMRAQQQSPEDAYEANQAARAQQAQRNLGSAMGGASGFGRLLSSPSIGSLRSQSTVSAARHTHNPSEASSYSHSSSSSSGGTTTHPHTSIGSGIGNGNEHAHPSTPPFSNPATPNAPSFSPFAPNFTSLPSSESSPKASPTSAVFVPAYVQGNLPPSPGAFSTRSGSSYQSNGEDWEGASDIYDNYFYRYSVASKMSGSRMSTMTVNSMRSRKQSATSVSAMPSGMGRKPSDYGEGEGAFPAGAAVTAAAAAANASTSSSTPPHLITQPPLHSLSLATPSDSPTTSLPAASPLSERAPVSPLSTASSSVNSHSGADDSPQMPSEIQPIEESQRPLMSRQNSLNSTALLSNGETVSNSRALSRKLIAVNGVDGEPSDDDESVYSDSEAKQRPGRFTMMEEHAAALISPENTRVHTTGALNIVKVSTPVLGSGFGSDSESGITVGVVSPVLRDASIPLTAAEAQARLAASNIISSSNSSSSLATLSPNLVNSTPTKTRPSPLDLENPTRGSIRNDGQSQLSGHSIGPSPLLHTRWGSPLSSAGFSSGTASVYSDGTDTDTNLAGGIANLLRQRSQKERNTILEQGEEDDHGERSMSLDIDGERFNDLSLVTAMDQSTTSTADESHAGNISRDHPSERGLVIEDDEELPEHAKNEEVDLSIHTQESIQPLMESGREESEGSLARRKSLSRIIIDARSSEQSLQSQTPQIGVISADNASPKYPSSEASPYSASDLPLDLLPPPSPSTFPPTSPIASQGQVSHLRPTLNELRGYTPGQGERQSLFMPHPNAPKAPTDNHGMGPMFIRGTMSPSPAQRAGPDPRKVAANVLQMVLASPSPQPSNIFPPPSSAPIRGANGRTPPPPPPTHLGPTIYARVDVDLATSTGPVPVTFSVQPLGPPPLPAMPMQRTQSTPLAQDQQVVSLNDDRRPPPSPALAPPPSSGFRPQASGTPPPQGRNSPFQGAVPVSGRDSPVETDLDFNASRSPRKTPTTLASPPKTQSITPSAPEPSRPSGDIIQPRPRSRSFSAFGFKRSSSSTSSSSVPALPTRDNGTSPALRSRGSSTSLTTAASSAPPSPPSRSLLTKQPSNTKLRAAAGPSPLSLPQNNITLQAGIGGIKPPLNPLPSANSPQTAVFPSSLRKVTSASSLRDSKSSSISRTIGDVGSVSPPSSPTARRTSRKQSMQSATSDVVEPQSPKSPTLMPRSLAGDSEIGSMRSMTVSPTSTLAAPPSLHTKLSLPNLQRLPPPRHDSFSSMTALPSPMSTEPETVQVQDMDFELVRPTLGFAQASGRSSLDSNFSGVARGSDGRPDLSTFLRAESPTVSIASTGSRDAVPRSKPMTKSSSDNEANNESHRQREQKWMTVMGSVPPSQSRKSKKVRKLVGEGVPSSVRYLVWSHLTDCKAKNVPGVYANFVKRAKVPSFQDIDRDVKQCFGEHPHLQATEGPLLSLLQAYLTMVPDVQYATGLTLISGQLLLLAPEEDAFWIFVTMMDSVLRPYFSPNSTQLEVDAALFSRALEANDAQVSKKVLVDMSMNPANLCSPWFCTLFVGVIPGDYVTRVWDLFLYEGVPFLIRVGLAITYCCRRAILEATSEAAVLQYLKRPSATWLPPSPEAFVTLALSFKVKDDDVRKQRVKMEAQVKRQTQAPPRTSGNAISLPR
ncbi:hypothetical protein D9758_009039 [Tetrapyrgos nigripes]|uniref:SH3 domain-containing protein n=1 Tax=Tetrapyrgos nigripes TaxID=182062 RepID=A0A8H5GA23_9AGAR|nr:hypothetical protein D9758_009039 [Tetrapyrgos nigripes]